MTSDGKRALTLAALATSALAQFLGAGAVLAPTRAERGAAPHARVAAHAEEPPAGRHVDLGARRAEPSRGYVEAGPRWSRPEPRTAPPGPESSPGRYVDAVRWGGLAPQRRGAR